MIKVNIGVVNTGLRSYFCSAVCATKIVKYHS